LRAIWIGCGTSDEATSVATDGPLYQADKTAIDVIEWHAHQVLGIGLFDIASLRERTRTPSEKPLSATAAGQLLS
jgi:hypothetical protein